ncbi:unnamed protein product [Mytilus coruscus]|uniref:EGF-like domain-containing protein n=1 Tax=Mytilus coruscus TaxID=42192 RepID=A0A6J8C050_MYTCO|nr:unnamed protein product [Mytilus coruscus]
MIFTRGISPKIIVNGMQLRADNADSKQVIKNRFEGFNVAFTLVIFYFAVVMTADGEGYSRRKENIDLNPRTPTRLVPIPYFYPYRVPGIRTRPESPTIILLQNETAQPNFLFLIAMIALLPMIMAPIMQTIMAPSTTTAPVTMVTNPCTPNPCLNGGVCQSIGTTFMCNCRSGFTGITCDMPLECNLELVTFIKYSTFGITYFTLMDQ